jgi:hypothetical protein
MKNRSGALVGGKIVIVKQSHALAGEEEDTMPRRNHWLPVVLIFAALHLSACDDSSSEADDDQDDDHGPAKVEQLEESGLSRLTLTAKAAERLDIKTVPASEAQLATSLSQGKVVPYAAVLYDANGDTWVYTSPEPQVFIRHKVTVEYIDGDQAVLSDGPPVGTPVVTVGAAELFGTEFEIGH